MATELMGKNGQQVPLMSSVDKFLLSATRRSRKAAIPQLILDKALRSAAMSLTGQLSATETAQWVETIESRELSRKPWCKVYLDFAHDDSTAEKILKICDADCRPVGDDTLRVNRERFPKVIDEYLSQLANSKSISDNIRVIRVLGGDHFGDFPKSTVSLKAISNGASRSVSGWIS